MNAVSDFRQAIEAAGLRPPDGIIADGTLQRCGTEGREHGSDGAYIFYSDPPPSGWFRNWRTGTEDSWSSGNGNMTPEQKRVLQERIERAKATRQAEEAKRRAEARDKAAKIYGRAKPCPADHPYLRGKGIKPAEGIRATGDGKIIVPVYDPKDNGVMSLQFIDKNGDKKFLPGGKTSGGYFPIKGTDGPLFIAEGFATARTINEATGFTALAAFNAGNLIHVARSSRIRYQDRDIVLCADDDRETEGNPGVTAAEKAAGEISGRVIVPRFKDPAGKTDFNDLAQTEGLEAVKMQLMEAPKSIREPFKFLSLGEMLSEPRPVDWLVRGYLEGATLSVLFGEAGTMKSFCAIDFGLCIATGKPWHGQETKRGPVLFVAGEGFAGVGKRIKAWTMHHGVETAPFFVSDRPAQFLDGGSCAEVEAAISDISNKYGKPCLVVIDTLNRNFGPGDENATSDMTRFIAALDELRARHGCAVLVVHHSGLAEKNRSRGSSALRAALDFEFKIVAQDDVRTFVCTKAKDHEEPQPKHFKPLNVKTGWTDPETGEDIRSCVLEETDSPAKGKTKLSGAAKVALESLAECINNKGRERGVNDLSGIKIHVNEWREQANKKGISPTATDDAKRVAFTRAVRSLLDKDHICVSNDFYWIKDQGEQPNISEHVQICSPTPKRTNTNTPL
jgi:phage/plasmid primase-like uncharacterized protein